MPDAFAQRLFCVSETPSSLPRAPESLCFAEVWAQVVIEGEEVLRPEEARGSKESGTQGGWAGKGSLA